MDVLSYGCVKDKHNILIHTHLQTD
jgi:hypothetical protein